MNWLAINAKGEMWTVGGVDSVVHARSVLEQSGVEDANALDLLSVTDIPAGVKKVNQEDWYACDRGEKP